MLDWTDVTSYSQGQRGKAPQTAWEADLCGMRLWVSKGHLHYPDEWVMNCRAIGIVEKRLGKQANLSDEGAKNAAIEAAWRIAKDDLAVLNERVDLLFREHVLREEEK
jgi:hypothetical protein